jgi:hypothetical protein
MNWEEWQGKRSLGMDNEAQSEFSRTDPVHRAFSGDRRQHL